MKEASRREEEAARQPPSSGLSHQPDWLLIRLNKKENTKKKPRKIKLPTSDDELPAFLRKIKSPSSPDDSRSIRTKPAFVSPRVPFSNGNCSSANSSKKVAPPSSRDNGNISADADVKKPSGNSPDQLMDLSGCDDQKPRSGFVLPHLVGFQVILTNF